LLVTGATGFVMSVVARQRLTADPSARLVVLDAAPPDAAAIRYFAPVAERMRVVVADLTDPASWRDAIRAESITHVVHGATITPLSRGTAAEARHEPEAEAPARILDVNIMGTVAALEFARTLPNLKRFLYVSSGAVYKNDGPDHPGEPLPEDGYVMPRRLYGISKLTSELVTERYGELFGFSAVSVRLSSVYGTMDRVTASRNFRHVPNRLAHMAAERICGGSDGDGGGRNGIVRVNTLAAVGDYVHVEDVARAIDALLNCAKLRFGVYNIAAGETASVGELVEWAAKKAPGFRAEVTTAETADIVQDPSLTGGMWGAYDISRITAETGWRPRSTREAFQAYIDRLVAERGAAPA
jgi:UDP-glucose 4-epimerase